MEVVQQVQRRQSIPSTSSLKYKTVVNSNIQTYSIKIRTVEMFANCKFRVLMLRVKTYCFVLYCGHVLRLYTGNKFLRAHAQHDLCVQKIT